MKKIITFALQKGGVGKTSMSVTIAAELAKHGRTLLIDADPQGNASTWIANNDLERELSDVLNEKAKVQDVLLSTQISNLFILPTAGLGGELRSYQLSVEASRRPYALADAIEPVRDYFDYCVIDTSPNFDPLTITAITASNEVIAVLQFNEFSKDGLQIFLENYTRTKKDLHIQKNSIVFNRIILNAKDDRIKQQESILNTFRQLENDGYKLHIIPVDQAFPKAQAMHTSIQELSGTKKDTLQAVEKLVKEIIQ